MNKLKSCKIIRIIFLFHCIKYYLLKFKIFINSFDFNISKICFKMAQLFYVEYSVYLYLQRFLFIILMI